MKLGTDFDPSLLFNPEPKPSITRVTRAIEALQTRGFDPTPIEHGLIALAGAREPGDDDDDEDLDDEEETDLVSVSEVMGQIQAEMAAAETKRTEVISGSATRLAGLIGSSNRRRG